MKVLVFVLLVLLLLLNDFLLNDLAPLPLVVALLVGAFFGAMFVAAVEVVLCDPVSQSGLRVARTKWLSISLFSQINIAGLQNKFR